jgi:Flp pilus assembly protein TadG
MLTLGQAAWLTHTSKTILTRTILALRNFGSARRGNVAMIFALSIIPIMGIAGAANDYGHALGVKAVMQSAVDATALMASKNAASMTSSQLQASAQNYFTAQFNAPDVQNATISLSYSTSGGSNIVANGSASVPSYFMGIMGFGSMTVNASSTVKWGMSRLRVALVLDNTGSMADSGKITALKTATNNLLSQLQAATTANGDVYVSIIPFVKDVNVGQTNYNASWIDWTDWNAANGTCSGGGGYGGYGGYGGGSGSTKSTCGGTWTASNHNTWNGCVVDRGDENGPDPAKYDTNVVAPTASITATLFSDRKSTRLNSSH